MGDPAPSKRATPLTVGLSLTIAAISLLALTALASGLLSLLSATDTHPAPHAPPQGSSSLSGPELLILVYGLTGVALLLAIALAWRTRPRPGGAK